jgi:hypothetical protein
LAPDLSIIEAVMRAGDWPSCRVIHGLLPSDHYAHGRIKRDDTTLVFIPQGDNQPDFGWKAIGGTAYYVGELVDGKMEGSGRKVELGPQFFEGSFSNNALHGRCTYHDSRHPEYDFIGYYHDGKLIHKEPKHENSPITSLRAAFRLPTIGLKIKNE